MSATIRIDALDPYSDEAAALFAESDAFMLSIYPPEICYRATPEAVASGVLLVARDDAGAALGCGAVRPLAGAQGVGEVKRVFVRAAARGSGTGRRLMEALEAEARAAGWTTLMLETGCKQTAAIALYEGTGWRRRAPFGGYPNDPESIFMEKTLG